jgi:hypothetical protein
MLPLGGDGLHRLLEGPSGGVEVARGSRLEQPHHVELFLLIVFESNDGSSRLLQLLDSVTMMWSSEELPSTTSYSQASMIGQLGPLPLALALVGTLSQPLHDVSFPASLQASDLGFTFCQPCRSGASLHLCRR